jgi:WD40 repeat protein
MFEQTIKYYLKLSLVILFIFHYNSINSYSEIIITSPTPTDTLIVGRNFNVQWTKTVDYSVNLYYTIDYGKTWELIEENIEDNEYSWNIPPLDSLQLRFRAVASKFEEPRRIDEIIDAHAGEVRSVDINEENNLLLSAGKDSRVVLWNFAERTFKSEIDFEDKSLFSAKFLDNASKLVVAVENTVLLINDIATGEQEEIQEFDFSDDVRALDVHDGKRLVAAGSFDGKAIIYDMNSGTANIFTPKDNERVYSVRFSRDGEYFCFGTYTGDAIVIKTSDNSEVAYFESEIKTGNGLLWAVDIAPDNEKIVTGLINSSINEFNVASNSKIKTLEDHEGQIRVLNYHPALKDVLFSASLDGSFLHWNMLTGEKIHEKTADLGQILSAKYYANGDGICIGTRGGDIFFWQNYKYVEESDALDLELRYPLVLRLPDVYTKLNERVDIPVLKSSSTIEYYLWTEFPGWNRTMLDFPSKMLYVLTDVENNPIEDRDTILYSFDDYAMEDTLFTLKCFVMLSDKFDGDLKILASEFENNPAYKIFVEPGKLFILGDCIGEEPPGIKFRGEGLAVRVNPHPVKNSSELVLKMVEEGVHRLEIYRNDGSVAELVLERKFSETEYRFTYDFSEYSNGNYYLRLTAPSKSVDFPFIINR